MIRVPLGEVAEADVTEVNPFWDSLLDRHHA
jgi:hypothetical protein